MFCVYRYQLGFFEKRYLHKKQFSLLVIFYIALDIAEDIAV